MKLLCSSSFRSVTIRVACHRWKSAENGRNPHLSPCHRAKVGIRREIYQSSRIASGEIASKGVVEPLPAIALVVLGTPPNGRVSAYLEAFEDCRDLTSGNRLSVLEFGPRSILPLHERRHDLGAEQNFVPAGVRVFRVRFEIDSSRKSLSSDTPTLSSVTSPDNASATWRANFDHSPPATSAIATQISQASAARSLRSAGISGTDASISDR